MDAKSLIEFRKQAEQAVADMSDGDLKLKAFEVILAHLIGGRPVATKSPSKGREVPVAGKRPRRESESARSITSRILVLRDEGFFNSQKAIGEVREELRAHGWHYPLTTLSGRLQALVQQRELRRERVRQGNKKIWKYSNP
ncbi:MAG: hypothetical protein ACRD3M_16650 [Thermoanaerobaculia bacterium]